VFLDGFDVSSIDELREAMAKVTDAGQYKLLHDLSAISDVSSVMDL